MSISFTPSRARAQRCLFCEKEYPLYPPIVGGCPNCATDSFKAPLELVYDDPPNLNWLPINALPGIERYAPLLPPLAQGLSMGEGGTPLVRFPAERLESGLEVWIKDESRNPTWSHKDRLNLAVVSAALKVKARGVVAASSGNHGASTAAYSARAGLPGVILTTPRPPAIAGFLQAYGQLVVAVPTIETRWELMTRLVEEYGFHPASNQTIPPTNHPFGAESYKTIAYELFLQMADRPPEAVFVPVGFAELIFGIYKGFAELHRYGLIEKLPKMIACEPAAGGPLKRAIEQDKPSVTVEPKESVAYSIAVSANSYRGVVAVRGSNGMAVSVTEDEIRQAQYALARTGLWVEKSSAVAFAGALHATQLGLWKGPLACIHTSSGFKDADLGQQPVQMIDGSWESLIKELIKKDYLVNGT